MRLLITRAHVFTDGGKGQEMRSSFNATAAGNDFGSVIVDLPVRSRDYCMELCNTQQGDAFVLAEVAFFPILHGIRTLKIVFNLFRRVDPNSSIFARPALQNVTTNQNFHL